MVNIAGMPRKAVSFPPTPSQNTLSKSSVDSYLLQWAAQEAVLQHLILRQRIISMQPQQQSVCTAAIYEHL